MINLNRILYIHFFFIILQLTILYLHYPTIIIVIYLQCIDIRYAHKLQIHKIKYMHNICTHHSGSFSYSFCSKIKASCVIDELK